MIALKMVDFSCPPNNYDDFEPLFSNCAFHFAVEFYERGTQGLFNCTNVAYKLSEFFLSSHLYSTGDSTK